jgi:hypothetical protein
MPIIEIGDLIVKLAPVGLILTIALNSHGMEVEQPLPNRALNLTNIAQNLENYVGNIAKNYEGAIIAGCSSIGGMFGRHVDKLLLSSVDAYLGTNFITQCNNDGHIYLWGQHLDICDMAYIRGAIFGSFVGKSIVYGCRYVAIPTWQFVKTKLQNGMLNYEVAQLNYPAMLQQFPTLNIQNQIDNPTGQPSEQTNALCVGNHPLNPQKLQVLVQIGRMTIEKANEISLTMAQGIEWYIIDGNPEPL